MTFRFLAILFLCAGSSALANEFPHDPASWSLDYYQGVGVTYLEERGERGATYATEMVGLRGAWRLSGKNIVDFHLEGGALEDRDAVWSAEGLGFSHLGIGYRRFLTRRFSLGLGYASGHLEALRLKGEMYSDDVAFHRLNVNASYTLLQGQYAVKALNLTGQAAVLGFDERETHLGIGPLGYQSVLMLELVMVPPETKMPYHFSRHCGETCVYWGMLQFVFFDVPSDLVLMAWDAF